MTAGTGGSRTGDSSYILAAGGLLERTSGGERRIAVVHRTRYLDRGGGSGDVVLPKGKKEPDESLEETALREVREETGCTGRVVGPAFSAEHVAHGVPKVTTYFRMECVEEGEVGDASEIADVMWLTPGEAAERLTYDNERAIVEQAYPARSGEGG